MTRDRSFGTDRRQPRAFHVGRSGEVAGGMAQVLNGYRSGNFDEFDIRIVESRDGSRGLAAIRIVAAAARQLWRLASPHQGDVVVIHLSERGSFVREGALLLLARARGCGTVAHLHGSDFDSFARSVPILVRIVLRASHRVIVLSERAATTARNFVEPERIVLVPNAVHPGESTPEEQLIVFGGAVGSRKGVDVLLEAWRVVRQLSGVGHWRLMIAGPIVEQKFTKLLGSQVGTGVEYLGPLSHRSLMALLDRSAIAVLPSRDEAMPVFILEAMVRHNCVIATDVGGIAAVLAQGAGIVIAPGDVAALVTALTWIINDDLERTLIGNRAAAAIRDRYAAAKVYPLLEEVWAAAARASARTKRSAPVVVYRGEP